VITGKCISMNSAINSTGDSSARDNSTGLCSPLFRISPISEPKFTMGYIVDNYKFFYEKDEKNSYLLFKLVAS
jgi:hypothetical protein